MIVYVRAFGALLLGCALRTLLPYIVAGLNAISEAGEWEAWPRFEPKYLSAFALAIIAYVVVLATVPGALAGLLAMSFVAVVAMAYAGEDLAREAIKLVFPKLR